MTARQARALLLLGVVVLAATLVGSGLQDEAASREPAGRLVLDPNIATRAELQTLPGLGSALAGRILEERARGGPFRTVDELRRVHGIGPWTLARLRPFLVVAPVEVEEPEA